MFYTYILYSESLGLFYKGSTSDVAARLDRHNSKMEKFTRKGVPWKLIWYTEKESKSEAYQLELKLKNLSRKRLVDFMLKYKDDITSTDELLFIQKLSEC